MTLPTILLLGTCDTKLPELLYTQSRLSACKTLIIDIGRNASTDPSISITHADILAHASNKESISHLDRSDYITALIPHATATVQTLFQEKRIHGVMGIGGSCGTALATALMRDALPVGFPKLMVSTMASGDVGPYVGETDICMMYSVVDIAGRNRVLETVLGNAAGAISGMASFYLSKMDEDESAAEGPRIGISMFGVTTPAVTRAREYLEEVMPGCEVYVFHATGSGGRALERLVQEGVLDAVLDLTTTEICDEVVGGVLSAGESRLCAATKRDLPRVVSVGACDMVNFGTPESVPGEFLKGENGRVFHHHNPTVTLMRTTREECAKIGKVIAKNVRGDGVKWTRILLPTGGVSMLDVPGHAFWDPEADEVLFATLEDELRDIGIPVIREERQINDPDFAVTAAEMLRQLIEEHRAK
ncbi:uncharacterized protein N7498_004165 [Penicillium cinerascens]|uniref:Uncharacterized protein n=1 Tax=Penicillium cinerascens TaxID=70096 RepID=A0A9W9N3J8_9EURO|nr:uncharacterized protein N7498_004165 [Penicillium cinerascens]KAJ5212519.1 hypothetical protein N7498_004165 [Penicillium cinerascens]